MSSKKILFKQCAPNGFQIAKILLVVSWIHETRFGFLFTSNLWLCHHFRDAGLMPLARHGWCHTSFQFSPRIFEGILIFLVVRINEINSFQSSSSVEFRFFFCIPVSLDSERLSQFSSKTTVHTWSGLAVDWIFVSFSRTTFILLEVSSSMK